MTDVHDLIERADRLAQGQVVRNAEIKGLREALAAIAEVPSERNLLLNAEARAMYEIAKRALESESVLDRGTSIPPRLRPSRARSALPVRVWGSGEDTTA